MLRKILTVSMAALLAAGPAYALKPKSGSILSVKGDEVDAACSTGQLPIGGASQLACSDTLPSGVKLSGAASTVAGAPTYDSTTKLPRLGDGSIARYPSAESFNLRARVDCTGATDSRAALKTALETGECAGHGCLIPDQCEIFLSSPGTASSSGTVATIPADTKLYFEGTGRISLGTKECVGGTYPGAACSGDSDCLGSGLCADNGQFAPGASFTYTLFAAATNARGIEIHNAAIYVNGVDPYARCSGGTNAGKPCKQTCSSNAGWGCATDAQCSGLTLGTCQNEADCSDAGGSCVSESGKPSGPGLIDIFSLDNAMGALVANARVYDHRQGNQVLNIGKPVATQGNAFGEPVLVPYDGSDPLMAPNRTGPIASLNRLNLLTQTGRVPRGEAAAATTTTIKDNFRVKNGIVAQGGALVEGNEVSASEKGIFVQGLDNLLSGNKITGTAPFSRGYYVTGSQNRMQHSRISAWGCVYGDVGTNNVYFRENFCLWGAGPKAEILNGGWGIDHNYFAWGSTHYCTDATASNYGGSCSCSPGVCTVAGTGGTLYAACDGNSDCGTGGTCTTGSAQSPCYDTAISDGNTTSCDATASKASCAPLGNVARIGQDGRASSSNRVNNIAHLRFKNNLVFSLSAPGIPLVKVVDQGGFCAASGANLYKPCTCVTYPCADSTNCSATAGTCIAPVIDDLQINDNDAPGPLATFVSFFGQDSTASSESGVTKVENAQVNNNILGGGAPIELPANSAMILNPIQLIGNQGVDPASITNLHPSTVTQTPPFLLTNKSGGSLSPGDIVEIGATGQSVRAATAAGNNAVGAVVQSSSADGRSVAIISSGPALCAYKAAVADITLRDRLKVSGSNEKTVDIAGSSDNAIAWALETKSTPSDGTVACFLGPSPPTSFPSVSGVMHTAITDPPTTNPGTRYVRVNEVITNASAQSSWAQAGRTYVAKGTFARMRCACGAAPGASKTRTFELVCGGDGTNCTAGGTTETSKSFSCSMTGTGTSNQNCTYGTALNVPDGGAFFALKFTGSGTPAATDGCGCDIVYTPDT